jgi:hypothetical protein
MSEKKYVKDYAEQMNTIRNALATIEKIVDEFPESSWKKSINTSVENFVVKIDNFLEEKVKLTKEQKEAIKAIRKGTISAEKVLQISESKPESNSDGNEEIIKPTGKGKKNH